MIFVSFDCDSDLDMHALPVLMPALSYPVTVFLIGKYVEKYPDYARLLAELDHVTLGNHTNTHPWSEVWGMERVWAHLPADERRAEVEACHRRIADTTGVQCRVFRSPHLSPVTDADCAVLADLGYTHDSSDQGLAKPHRHPSGIVEVPITEYRGEALSNWVFLYKWRRTGAEFADELRRLFDSEEHVNMYLDPRFFVQATEGRVSVSDDGRQVLDAFQDYRDRIVGYDAV